MNPEKAPDPERGRVKRELADYVSNGTPLPPETLLYFGGNDPHGIIQEIIDERLLAKMSVLESDPVRRW